MADLRPVYVAGDGDVKGPASSSNNFLPLFADTTGKLLKSSGTGVTTQGLAILDDNTPAEQRNTIGLDQVNNTSDVNKPVSTAQQTALNSKQDKLLYTPVQQGGGIGQYSSKVYIGWGNTDRLKITVDAADLGNVVFDSNTATESAVGVAKIATGDQVNAGLDDTSIVTPKKMKAAAYIIEKITGDNCRNAGLTSGGTQPYMQRLSDGAVIHLPTKEYVDDGLLTKITGENCQQAGLTAGGTLPYMKKTDGTVIHLATWGYVDKGLLTKITGENCTEAGLTAGGALPYMKRLSDGELIFLATKGYVDDGLLNKIAGDNCRNAGLSAGGTQPYMQRLSDGELIFLATNERVDNGLLNKITGENCRNAGLSAGGTLPYMQRLSDGVAIQLATKTDAALDGTPTAPTAPVGTWNTQIANTAFVNETISARPTIGVNQTWQDLTASRAKGVTYTNGTGRPIQIFVNFDPDGGLSVLRIAGHNFNVSDNSSEFVSAIIPAGATYSLSAWGVATTMKWLELR